MDTRENTMKISVVMPYYNRLSQLRVTLKTISMSSYKDIEIVIVDDASEENQKAKSIVDSFSLNIKVINVEKEEKWWANPCHAFNIGFREAKGDVIILQSPECLHYGDVLSYVVSHIKENSYLVFSCKNLNNDITARLQPICAIENPLNQLELLLGQELKIMRGWYNHPRRNARGYHFLSAITRENLFEVLNGFDERYSKGHAFDDDEFLERIKRSPIEIEMVDSIMCCCAHQYHTPIFPGCSEGRIWQINYDLFHMTTKREKTWKAEKGIEDLSDDK